MSTHQLERPADIDADDGQPVWPWSAGQVVVPGILATERLGVGLRCETWLCWSEVLCCPVVVKVARPHQATHPRARRSLGREVASLDGLLHPSLPRLYAHDLDAVPPYVVLEHLDGPALDEEIDRRGRLTAHEVALLGVQLLAALVPLHARGVAHLDLKPENVVLRGGRPVLVDFGSARRIGTPQPPGRPVGTVGYAAPEMEACEPISSTMDLYAAGATLGECLAGGASGRRRWLPRRTARRRHEGVATLVAELTRADPTTRPSLTAALDTLTALAGPEAGRPMSPSRDGALPSTFDSRDNRAGPYWRSKTRSKRLESGQGDAVSSPRSP